MNAFLRRRAEHLLNLALGLDAETRDSLRALHDKRIDIHVPDLGIAWRLRPGPPGRTRIDAINDETAELCVTARSTVLLAALSNQASVIDRLEVRGDVELLKHLEHLVRGYRPDVEGQLAGIIGDGAARQVCRTGHEAGTLTVRVARKLVTDLGAYLEDNGLAPGSTEVTAFIATVDQLRDRIERLAERVRGLERRAPG